LKTKRKRDLDITDEFAGENKVLEYARNVQQTNFTADIYYPLRKGASIQIKSGYTIGKADSQDIKQYYYEARLRYPVWRRLLLSAWFRDFHLQLANGIESDTKNIELILEYRVGRVYLNATYWLEMLKENGVERDLQRIYLKVRRSFG
jgi:hypothetical protein